MENYFSQDGPFEEWDPRYYVSYQVEEVVLFLCALFYLNLLESPVQSISSDVGLHLFFTKY